MADANFKKEFLNTHNDYRKKHGANPLKYNEEMNVTAQKWADHLLSTGVFQHSSTGDGENIFCMSSSTTLALTGKEAVESWFGEIKDYNFSSPGFAMNTGHFTQVVWKSTEELGVGLATDGNKVFVVAQYRPPGNVNQGNYFLDNVLQAADRESGGADNSSSEAGGGGGGGGEVSRRKTCTLL